jgi:cytoskeletal protein CcmA (bactofilin family)
MKKTDEICALLGEDTEFNGSLKFYGTIRIDGNFSGEIQGEGTLVVGEKGRLESNVRVSQIDVSGEVKGNIVADQKIEIRPSGRVSGDILSPTVIINEGAVFDGNCRTRSVGDEEEMESSTASPLSHEPPTPPLAEASTQKQSGAGAS